MESYRRPVALVPFVPFSSLLFIELLLLLYLHSALSRQISTTELPAYQVFDVEASLREAKNVPGDVKHQRKSKARITAWSMQVVHWDNLLVKETTNGTSSFEQRLEEKLRRDSTRASGLQNRIQKSLRLNKARPGGGYENVAEETAKFRGEVPSGNAIWSGLHLALVWIGTPPREQYMVLDLGADLTWIQCEPCRNCTSQLQPIFSPSSSSSFSTVRCDSVVCSQLDGVGSCAGGGCNYIQNYADGTATAGSLVTETVTFGNTSVHNLTIGCSHDIGGPIFRAAGVFGLGAGPLSFPTQLGTHIGGNFSYCLVGFTSNSSGILEFGQKSVPNGSILTTLQRNPYFSNFYYLSLVAISVSGELLNSTVLDVLRIDDRGYGGVIIDSGTTITHLQTAVYNALRSAFREGTRKLPETSAFSAFDTCYDLSGLKHVRVPSVGFHFSNGAILILPPKNYMIPVDTKGTFCFAFASSGSDIPSILGNFQLQNIQISFDSAKSIVAFSHNKC